MKNTVFISLITATAIAVAGGAAYAKSERHGAPVDFETLDTNADGQITLEEMQARGADRFATTDTDGDGFLSLQELEAEAASRSKDRAGKMMERHDANADGKLSMEELAKPDRGDRADRAERRFNHVDEDGDGAITKAEFDAAMAHMKEHHGRKGSK